MTRHSIFEPVTDFRGDQRRTRKIESTRERLVSNGDPALRGHGLTREDLPSPAFGR